MPHLHRVLLLALLALSALFIAACGEDEPKPSSNDAKDSRPAPAAESQPTVLESAKAKQAKVAVKQYVMAVESCGAGTTDGSLTGCLDATRLKQVERSLNGIEIPVIVRPGDDPKFSYVVTAAIEGGEFAEEHSPDGNIDRTCEPTNAPGCSEGSW